MWLLECSGDVFNHKKLWLRPGKSYLFGRTKVPVGQAGPDELSFAIANKSVSRKHLVIVVDATKSGDSERSQLRLIEDSKFGTTVDGVKFAKQERTLSGSEHTIKLGSFESTFKLWWFPVSLCFSFTEKQARSSEDALATTRRRVGYLDIQATSDYSIPGTTHVVSNKRNIAKGLQALINGKHIVGDGFLEAIEAAATSPGFDDDGKTPLASPLEKDFDGNWPNALDFLPGPGKEPHPRPAALFAPDERRLRIFEGFTFVFADPAQYANLSPALQNGNSKCLQYDLILGRTALGDFVDYLRSVDIRRDVGQFDDGSKGLVVVRFRGKGDTAQWALDFIRNLDLELGQRSVEQNEFLDAILLNDTSGLKRPLRGRSESIVPSTTAAQVSTNTAHKPEGNAASKTTSAPQNEPSGSAPKPPGGQPLENKRKIRRTVAKSRFKGFDDFDDDKFEPKHIPSSPLQAIGEKSQDLTSTDGILNESNHGSTDVEMQSETLFVNDSQEAAQQGGETGKKRKETANQKDDEDLFPAAATMKRRRLAENETVREDEPTTSRIAQHQVKIKPELDVRSAARSHATALDRLKHNSQDAGRNGDPSYDADEDISKLRNLAIVEEMVVGRSSKEDAREAEDQSTDPDARKSGDSRLQADWNGRKNFKRFRRRGTDPAINRGLGRRVIVRLEEVKQNGFSAGEDLLNDTARSRSQKSLSSTRSMQAESGSSATRRRTQQAREDDEDEGILPEEIAGTARDQSIADRVTGTRPSNSGGSESLASTVKGKRAASTQEASSSRAAKRTRPARAASPATNGSGSSDDDSPLKFRFRRKR